MKKLMMLAAMLGMFLLADNVAHSRQAVYGTNINPKNIQGYSNLYADLDKDGRVERVGLKRIVSESPSFLGLCYLYQIIVYNDRGKVIWRSPENGRYPFGTPIFYNEINHCLLHDIDEDGCVELVFSGWNCITDMNGEDNTIIYRWKNGKFVRLEEFRIYTQSKREENPDISDSMANFCKVDKHYWDARYSSSWQYVSQSLGRGPHVNDFAYEKFSGYSLIHNLRKVNGQLWGDIIVDSLESYDGRPLDKGCKWVNHGWHFDIYKTVRLVPYRTGMRIVEYKQ